MEILVGIVGQTKIKVDADQSYVEYQNQRLHHQYFQL